jgi:hypothetical protein
MNRRRIMKTFPRRSAVLAALLTAIVCVAAQIAAGASSNVRIVATQLNNPRGVAVAPDGSVFVAQAGAAGRTCSGSGENAQCLGFTGSIDRIANGTRERYGAGFASGGSRDGSFAVGVDGVTVSSSGQVYGIETTNGPKPTKFGAAFAAQAGHVLRVDHGTKTAIGDSVSAYEYKHNPAHDNLDSDPYGIAWSPLGFAVVDAAGNDLLLVNPSGRVSTLATFPAQRFGPRAAQSVPTSVAWHNGAFYVGELGGDGTPVGKSRIWKVVPGRRAEIAATGFTAISGLAFGPDGSMWVDELGVGGLAALGQGKLTGALIRVAPDGRRTQVAEGRLTAPAGVAVGADGTVYVANKSVFAGKGELLAITP